MSRPQLCGKKRAGLLAMIMVAVPHLEATTPGTRTFVVQLESCLAAARTLEGSSREGVAEGRTYVGWLHAQSVQRWSYCKSQRAQVMNPRACIA